MNKIIKLSVVCLLLLAGVIISGCVNTNSVGGKYVWSMDNQTYFILYENGTYFWHSHFGNQQIGYYESNTTGYYVYDDNTQMLEFKTGDGGLLKREYKSNPIMFVATTGSGVGYYVKQDDGGRT
jgi:hypothetical protein